MADSPCQEKYESTYGLINRLRNIEAAQEPLIGGEVLIRR